jgi:hypothetical protein
LSLPAEVIRQTPPLENSQDRWDMDIGIGSHTPYDHVKPIAGMVPFSKPVSVATQDFKG